ncbi:antibiotic biosynthesis monooxygenase family protein [Fibrella arboris]|uniref:antibiotic biosynthesis monooxygenase family protein n=1 Tax=Fibrella arboris TaxID=3242486 RepID=UPI003521A37B
MITEHAIISIQAGREAEFEAEFPGAQAVISQANGFIDLQLQRGIETPTTYLLLIHWQTLADHTVGFRQSALFTQWRAIIGPFFADPPVVTHFSPQA